MGKLEKTKKGGKNGARRAPGNWPADPLHLGGPVCPRKRAKQKIFVIGKNGERPGLLCSAQTVREAALLRLAAPFTARWSETVPVKLVRIVRHLQGCTSKSSSKTNVGRLAKIIPAATFGG
ncbi:unnamed protein product [Ranitomeya imitator]|uniref:Ribosomal protein S12 n=1 Tax=Ranitomeya imitator TaxID=111125 RepID=A0ABN9LGG3_9NEOB|nr:unnamed protein product [Ranitomeya imitator]